MTAFLCVDAGEHALPNHVVERLERQVRVDRARAVADQQREVMDFTRFTRLETRPTRVRMPLRIEMVMHARDSEQTRNRRVFAFDAAIATKSGWCSRPRRLRSRFLQSSSIALSSPLPPLRPSYSIGSVTGFEAGSSM